MAPLPGRIPPWHYMDELLDDEEEDAPPDMESWCIHEQPDIETARVIRPAARTIMRLRISELLWWC